MKRQLLAYLSCFFLFVCCEAPYVGNPSVEEDNANIVLNVSGFQVTPFEDNTSSSLSSDTRAEQAITEVCSRLTFAVYQGDTKYRLVTQKQGDTGFGTVAFSLPQGIYTVAIIGYSGDGCTVNSLEKITLKGLKDSFLYCSELEVTNQKTTYDVKLKRIVAKFLLSLVDEEIPDDVQKMRFTYSGGCTTFSALTSYGSTSGGTQTVNLDVATGQRQFEVYTIPHDETGTLKMTITALDANGNTVKERVFENVPVRCNAITTYTGTFFEGTSESGDVSFLLKADDAWEEGEEVDF